MLEAVRGEDDGVIAAVGVRYTQRLCLSPIDVEMTADRCRLHRDPGNAQWLHAGQLSMGGTNNRIICGSRWTSRDNHRALLWVEGHVDGVG